MKVLKKNQIIIYVIVLVIMTAGYLNYTTTTDKQVALETSMQMESKDDTEIADIGDATLVNSNDVVTDESNVVQTNSSEVTDDYFTKSKLERDTMYSQMLETYEKVLNSSNSSETQKQSATQEIKKINDTKNSIMICENLLKTKGFEDNIIFVNSESISVIIGVSRELNQEEIAQIQNIISREIKADIEDIHISTK